MADCCSSVVFSMDTFSDVGESMSLWMFSLISLDIRKDTNIYHVRRKVIVALFMDFLEKLGNHSMVGRGRLKSTKSIAGLKTVVH